VGAIDVARVLILIDHLKPYGAQRVAIDLARGIRNEGDHAALVTYKAHPESTAIAGDVEVIHLQRRLRSLPGMLEVTLKLRRLIKRGRYDTCIGVMTYANLSTALAITRMSHVRAVGTEHNIYTATHVGSVWRLARPVVRRLYRRLTCLVGVSNDVSRNLEVALRLEVGEVTTIYNPVDGPEIRARADDRCAAPPWPAGSVVYTVVGALKTAKGHELAIDMLARSESPTVLCIVGDGPLRGTLEAHARSSGVSDRMFWVGWQDNPWVWMRASDVLIVPSLYEGFGLVVAEAAVLGLRAVCSDVLGLGEIGRLFDSVVLATRDPAEWAEAAAKVATSRWAGIGGSVEAVSISSTTRRYLALPRNGSS
jgi:glycosyltransferase involved in cell wall biosynthesis